MLINIVMIMSLSDDDLSFLPDLSIIQNVKNLTIGPTDFSHLSAHKVFIAFKAFIRLYF
jgi:hypothetical protein